MKRKDENLESSLDTGLTLLSPQTAAVGQLWR